MTRLSAAALALFLAGCGGESLPGPSPIQAPPAAAQSSVPNTRPAAPPAFTRDVAVGERVEATFGDGRTIDPQPHHYFVVAPSSGRMEITLTWDVHALGTLLKLEMEGDASFAAGTSRSPIVALVPVETGQRYRIVVSLYGADWLPEDPYVLTTRISPQSSVLGSQ